MGIEDARLEIMWCFESIRPKTLYADQVADILGLRSMVEADDAMNMLLDSGELKNSWYDFAKAA